MSKILLIGLGGVGCEIVRSTLQNFHRRLGADDRIDGMGIDYETHGELYVFRDFVVGDAGSQVDLLWHRDQYFKTYWPANDKGPFSSTGQIGRGAAAGQLRPNGRLAAVTNYASQDGGGGICGALNSFFIKQGVMNVARGQQRGDFKIFVISSLGGGTGSGIMHDVIFACRSMINVNDYLIGLFVDGVVVKAWAEAKTGTMGYSALVEIEHFMTNPKDYYLVPIEKNHEQLWEEHHKKYEKQSRLNYLDLCLLVSRFNQTDNSLLGTKTGSIDKDYVELVAGWLYAFLAGDVLTRQNSKSKIFENVLNRFRGNSQAIVIGDGRSHQYGSIGCSMLSIPIRKISQYLSSSVIIDLFESAISKDSAPDKDPSQYLQERQLDQTGGSSVREILRSRSNSYKNIMTRYEGAKGGLQKSRRYRDVIDVVKTYKLPASDTDWLGSLRAYIEELMRLSKDLLDQEIDHLDKWLTNELHYSFPNHLEDWLVDFVNRLDKCIYRLTQTSHLQSSDWVNQMKGQCNAVARFRAMAQVFKWEEAKDRLLKPLSFFYNALQKDEASTMIEYLYNPLRSAIQIRISCLQEMNGQIRTLMETQRRIRQQFIIRDWFIDEEKLMSSYHPLELEIGTHQSFITRAETTVKKNFDSSEILDQLSKRVELEQNKSIWETFVSYYQRLLVERKREHEDPATPTGARAIIENMSASLNSFVREKVVNKIEDIISREISLQDALTSFLREKYEIAKNYNRKSASARDIRRLFIAHFGSNGAEDLLDVQDRKEDAWREKATAYLVMKLAQFSAPFWKQNWTQQHDLDTHHHQGWNRSQKFIYVQSPPIRSILQKESELVGNTYQVAPIDDKHSLAIVQMIIGYPLYSVTSWAEDKIEYLSHLQKWQQGQASEPFHVDQRFYVEWKDDLSQAQRQDQEVENLIILSYLLAVGSGVMSGGSKTKSKYVFREKSLATTLPKLDEKLHKKPEILERLTSTIYNELVTTIAQAAANNHPSMEKLWEILKKGFDDLASIQPPRTKGTAGAYAIWDRFYNAGRIEHNGGNWDLLGRLIPKDQNDFRKLEEQLRPKK